ncbi:MAG: hypothetical protein ACRYFU_07290 [Janthinobacterium lividum]
MEIHGRSVEATFTDRLATFADHWWPIAVVAFGAFGFLFALPHKYPYYW